MNYRSGQAPDHLRRSAIARGTLRWVERNAVPSPFLQGVFRRHGIKADVIPNIVDVDRFSFRKRQPLAPKVLSTRNFEELYNVACTLRAFRLVQDRYAEATLTLVGAGSEEPRLRALASELGLRNVHFAGRVAPADIWRYYADADIYLQTPDIDNMPSSVLEAFASGCAVVSTNAGGVPAILTDDRHGLLVECGDHQSRGGTDRPAARRPGARRPPDDCGARELRAVPVADSPLEVGGPLRRDGGHPRGGEPADNQRRMIRTLQRLAAMQPEELRFRTLCELRKLRGRVVTTLSRPAWQRSALDSILDGRRMPSGPALRATLKRGDYREAHGALAAHFATRRSTFPINGSEVASAGAAIRHTFPSAPEVARARADSVIRGRYDLLGYRGVQAGTSPDWHTDVVHRRHSPRTYWASVPYLDPAAGDHKVIWELNRHQHWLFYGRAHALTGESRFYDAFQRQLSDWLAANPPLVGTNWASMLELAFRCLTWLWTLELFASSASRADREPWIVDLLVALDRQLTHIEHNLSLYFSPNTHLSGEALALYVAGCALPELKASARRAAIGRTVLIQEATRQIRADGGHAELSAHYHRYSTDFYLLAARVAQRATRSGCVDLRRGGAPAGALPAHDLRRSRRTATARR